MGMLNTGVSNCHKIKIFVKKIIYEIKMHGT